jgi:3-oxoacyl-[acyl-carrier protein] reductase
MLVALDPARRFADRIALVTGGSRGIGAGIAVALAAEGARVIVSGRDKARLDGVVAAIQRRGGSAMAIAAELTDDADVARLREQAERGFGPVTILVGGAGGGGEPKPLAEESAERWRRTVETNLTAQFLVLHTFLPPMLEKRSGSVVVLSSSAGRQLSGASAPYAAAKAGLLSLMRQAALEAAPHGVRVNAIAPSAIVTDRIAALPVEQRERIAAAFPLRRIGEIGDVVGATLFLLSDAAEWITGCTLDVAGGRVML